MIIDFFHTFEPSPIIAGFGFVTVYWYGFLMTLAFVVGVFVTVKIAQRYDIDCKHIYDVAFYLVVFGLLSARLYHVLNELPYYIANPSQIIAFWNGGLALHGALIGGALTIYWYVRKHFKTGIKIFNFQFSIFNSTLLMADMIAPAMVLGQAIGRWGNYFNQELYGLPTNLPWGIPIALANRVAGFESFTHFHPTFLYESILSILIFAVLMYFHKLRIACYVSPVTKRRELINKPGFIATVYLVLYSLVRIIMEIFRIDTTPIILGIRLPIIVSGLLIVVSAVFLVSIHRNRTKA